MEEKLSKEAIYKRVKGIILQCPEGLEYSALVKFSGLSNEEVWNCLRKHAEFYRQNNKYFVKGEKPRKTAKTEEPKEKYNLILAKCENREGMKPFSHAYFNALADWEHCIGHSKNRLGTHKTKTGRLFDYDSKAEEKMLKYLDRTDFIIDVGGQNFLLPYDSDFADGKKYYPDIVVYTKTGNIIFIEVKTVATMSYHLNLSKYNALKAYCEKMGYGYMMVDPCCAYTTVEEFKNRQQIKAIETVFEALENNPPVKFNKTDIDEWYNRYRLYREFKNRNAYYDAVRAYIIKKNWYNRKEFGFEVTDKPVHR